MKPLSPTHIVHRRAALAGLGLGSLVAAMPASAGESSPPAAHAAGTLCVRDFGAVVANNMSRSVLVVRNRSRGEVAVANNVRD